MIVTDVIFMMYFGHEYYMVGLIAGTEFSYVGYNIGYRQYIEKGRKKREREMLTPL